MSSIEEAFKAKVVSLDTAAGKRVLVFSMEMPPPEHAERAIMSNIRLIS